MADLIDAPSFRTYETPLIKVAELPPRHKDTRGSMYTFKLDPPRAYVMHVSREEGMKSGNHYHNGLSLSKSPEIFYLARGTMEITVQHIGTREKDVIVVDRPSLVHIPARVHHTLLACTPIDFIELFIEKDNFDDDTIKGPLPDLEARLP